MTSQATARRCFLPLIPYVWFIFCVAGTQVHAAPTRGELFDLRQPDGSLVAVRIWGDEYYQIIESLDDYTLIRDPDTETICYATLNAVNSDLLSTGIAVQDSIPSELDLPLHIRPSQETISQVVTVHRQSYKPGYDNGEQCQTIQVLPQRTSTQGTVMGLVPDSGFS